MCAEDSLGTRVITTREGIEICCFPRAQAIASEKNDFFGCNEEEKTAKDYCRLHKEQKFCVFGNNQKLFRSLDNIATAGLQEKKATPLKRA